MRLLTVVEDCPEDVTISIWLGDGSDGCKCQQ